MLLTSCLVLGSLYSVCASSLLVITFSSVLSAVCGVALSLIVFALELAWIWGYSSWFLKSWTEILPKYKLLWCLCIIIKENKIIVGHICGHCDPSGDLFPRSKPSKVQQLLVPVFISSGWSSLNTWSLLKLSAHVNQAFKQCCSLLQTNLLPIFSMATYHYVAQWFTISHFSPLAGPIMLWSLYYIWNLGASKLG